MKLPQTKTKELCIITLVQPRKDLFRELLFHLSVLDCTNNETFNCCKLILHLKVSFEFVLTN